jgi:transposase
MSFLVYIGRNFKQLPFSRRAKTMSAHFVPADRAQQYLFPPSIQDWLPESHLARFIVDIVSQLDLRELSATYAGKGVKAYHPSMLVALLFYGYATGVFSSRKLEQATYDSIAFRYITANSHPDHDTIAAFRKRFLDHLKPLFVQILEIASALGVFKLGKVSLDGTKIKANASKHRALSWDYATKLQQQLQEEVDELLRLAETADADITPDGMNIPEELTRRQERLAAIAGAKQEIELRAAKRYEQEQEAHAQKMAARQKKAEQTGRKPGGREPQPPETGPRKNDQVNLTDEESRIMPSADKGFVQAYNAQAGVDVDTMLIVESHVSQAPNDKQEIVPTLEALKDLPEDLGKVEALLADAGYASESNLVACTTAKIEAFISPGRESHNQPLAERFSEPAPLANDATPLEEMRHKLKTVAGRAIYAKRKCTVEPVFGIIKQALGFRQFLLRGLEAVTGEWTLVSIAWNLKRIFALK